MVSPESLRHNILSLDVLKLHLAVTGGEGKNQVCFSVF